MKITSKQAFSLLRIIEKMELKKDLIDAMNEQMKLENKLQEAQKELRELAEEKGIQDITEEQVKELFEEDQELKIRFSELQQDQRVKGLELLFLVLEKLPNAEKEVFTFLSKVYEIPVSEIEELEFDEVGIMIKNIILSESFQRFFTLILK